MTIAPPASPAAQCQPRSTRGRPGARLAARRPTPTSAALTATGDQTGPTHGTGMRNRRSVVPSDAGQPANTYSQA